MERVGKLAARIEEADDGRSGDMKDLDGLIEEILSQSQGRDNEFLIQVLSLFVDYEAKISKNRFFHVAFARMMELTNKIQSEISNHEQGYQDSSVQLAFRLLLLGLHPYAPHLTAEIWQ